MKATVEQRFWGSVNRGGSAECWLWTAGRGPKGYGQMTVNSKKVRAHRLSWTLHNGPIPDGMLVCHHCDNPPCVNPSHLFLGTNLDNKQDSVRKGRQHRAQIKLTEQGVREMRRLKAQGVGVRQLGRMYAVDPKTVRAVVAGRTWKHVV